MAVRPIDGVGDVLVDSSGKALYAADVEADGKVKCVGACESFWKPLTVGFRYADGGVSGSAGSPWSSAPTAAGRSRSTASCCTR